MSPVQEKLLYEMSKQLGELHGAFYKNGFQARVKKIEAWIDDFPKYQAHSCIGVPLIRKHIDEMVAVETALQKRRSVRMAVIGVGIGLVAAIPGYLAFAYQMGWLS